jgi:hypothetical protein
MKSQGQDCHPPAVDAESLLQFTLRTIVTAVKRAGGAEKLRPAIEARARAAGSQPQTPEPATHAEIHGRVEKFRRQVEQAPRRILAAEDDDVRAMLHSALGDLRAELTEREKTLAEVAAGLPTRSGGRRSNPVPLEATAPGTSARKSLSPGWSRLMQ